MKTWDVAIIGGGVIALALARRLRHQGASVLVVEKGEPAREATYAAGGMIAHCAGENRPELGTMIAASARVYRAFVAELRAEAFESPDLRCEGTIAFLAQDESAACDGARAVDDAELSRLEPLIALRGRAYFLPECSVDPRKLGSALEKAARTLGVDFVTGSPVREVAVLAGRAIGVRTAKSFYPASAVVNCAGAWAGEMQPFGFPTRPVKGQMVCMVPATTSPTKSSLGGTPGTSRSSAESHAAGALIRHVVRTPEVYIVPRSDGRLLLGATVEEAGFDKRVDPDVVRRFYDAAVEVVSDIAKMRIHEAWAGLRPGTPDGLPIMGESQLKGYYAATGHFRDGIMLAPITAELMAQLIAGRTPELDLGRFSPLRFASG